MLAWLSKLRLPDLTPKSVICFREGYTLNLFWHDLFAGVSVGVIALPLALAFAIGSGVEPEQGLYTAIVAGFLISLLGGSRVQIAGPTGAFIVLVYAIVQRHGYDGLALATFLAGIMLILMGLLRCGALLKFIPFSVTTGFTTGLALVIFMSQIKDFFGIDLDNVPPKFVDKCWILCLNAHTYSPWAAGMSITTLTMIFILRYYFPKFPGAIFGIVAATLITSFFSLPLETIASKFGEIPSFPLPTFPSFSLGQVRAVFPDAIAIALLGAIESLLSAVIADGMTGQRHRSNCELVAQGFGNIGSVIFFGIPASGGIARTSANIRLGAKTPMAGMIHAVTLLLLIVVFAPWASLIPLPTLSAVLVYIAWNMSELHQFIHILKGRSGDALILVTTFALTVLVDIVAAVQVGVVLSAVLFLKKMTDKTIVRVVRMIEKENVTEGPGVGNGEILFRDDVPKDTVVFEIKGPFFYSVADLLVDTLGHLPTKPRVFILRMRDVPLVDATGINALKQFANKCKRENIIFLVSELQKEIAEEFKRTHLDEIIGSERLFHNIDSALDYDKSKKIEPQSLKDTKRKLYPEVS